MTGFCLIGCTEAFGISTDLREFEILLQFFEKDCGLGWRLEISTVRLDSYFIGFL
ncbi:unnamed protein product [Schistosoma mattheei]|uniref:Uncharacterized protein n=1 Tax=Schistosoma mattheei TaxID=31246 RepID=A0A3P8F3H0_9TREM|nr:unnamed protein product [Schistosoma mattheei]